MPKAGGKGKSMGVGAHIQNIQVKDWLKKDKKSRYIAWGKSSM